MTKQRNSQMLDVSDIKALMLLNRKQSSAYISTKVSVNPSGLISSSGFYVLKSFTQVSLWADDNS